MNDLKLAFRQALKNPGFTAATVLTLGICLGANVLIFAVVDSVLLRPLPFREPDSLVTTVNAYPKAGVPRGASSLPNYYDRRAAIAAFEKTAAIREESVIIDGDDSPRRVPIARVSSEFFATLGVKPARGRFFTEDEMEPESSRMVVLTDDYWRAQLNADPNVIGRQLRVDGFQSTIVGVLPAGFRYLSSRIQLFLPLASNPENRTAQNRHSNNLNIVARLRPGATLVAAQAQIDALNAQQLLDDPFAEIVKGAGYRTGVYSLHADHVQPIRRTLVLLQGGVLLLLVIGAVNLVNLFLVRASGRAKEFAVRRALGAGRWRIVRLVVFETVLLGCAGGALGLALGAAGVRLLTVLGIDQLPLGATVALSGRVALLTLLASVLAGLALALPTIWFVLHGKLALLLQTESRGGTANRAAQRLRHAFIVAQVALAFVLLVGAGLLTRSLQRVLAVSPGFQPDHVLTGQLLLTSVNYRESSARLTFIERLLREVQALPGVSFAGINTTVPMASTDSNAISVEGHVPQPGEALQAHYTAGSAGHYWQAMGVPLREGRFLEESDNHREQRVCLVDEDFAKRYWPGGTALGRRIVYGPTLTNNQAHTIVGVVGRVKHNELGDTAAQGAVYYPYLHYASSGFYLVIRTSRAPETFAATLRQIVLRLDPQLPIDDLRPMQTRIDDSLIARRSPALLAGIFAAAALFLAGIGTYGVLAYAVSQRHREIGVRIALGALPSQIRSQFLRAGARLLAAGLALGGLGTWGVVRAMNSVLFEAHAIAAGVIGITAAGMTIAMVLACWFPAHRASRLDPMDALRCE
jgi:predicted permease